MARGLGAFCFPLILVMAALLAASASSAAGRSAEPVLAIPGARFEPLNWSNIDGWAADDHAAAFAAFLASCRSEAMRRPPAKLPHATDAALRRVCAAARSRGPASAAQARAFFEHHFMPVRIARLEATEGFLTGYYEPVVEGSRQRTDEFSVPVYRQPDDLIPLAREAGLASSRAGASRLANGKQVPYYDRAAIEDGALEGRGLEICWLKNPIDAFFMHIQGSARVALRDGTMLRLNYAAHNGYPYTPVGRLLVERGAVPREEMSMARIRQWMEAHPDEAKALRRQNRSYIFFRVATLAAHEEAVGAQGIPLTAGRSLAVDRRMHAYGTPFWLDARLPLTGDTATDPFRRLMIAQDTGSAIVGPARADIYFGAGAQAGQVAGRIRHPATVVMLLPRGVALTTVRQPAPLPRARPRR